MSLVEIRINGRYKLGQKIASSSYGDIYVGKNVQSNQDVAIKMELSKKKYHHLVYEAKVLQYLQGGIGIPTLYWAGLEGDYNITVMDLLGKNLEELFNLCGKKFTLKTVLMVADQLISNIEYIHFKNYVHRNVKPENFLIGIGKKSHKIYTVDFALSKIYRDPKTLDHLAYDENKRLIGSARYASVNAHKGIEQTRRDDLESIGYILLYFLKGNLPWQNLEANSFEEFFTEIKERKINIGIDMLCGDLPQEFGIYLNYCRNLKFDEKPDYGHVKKIFKELFVKSGYEYDYVYDWLLIPYDKESDDEIFDNQELTKHLEDPNFIDMINEDEEKTIQLLIDLSKKKFERKVRRLSIESLKNEEFIIEEVKKGNDAIDTLIPHNKRADLGVMNSGLIGNIPFKHNNLMGENMDLQKKGAVPDKGGKNFEKKKTNKNEPVENNKKGGKKKEKDCVIF